MKFKHLVTLVALTGFAAIVVACANQPNYRSATLSNNAQLLAKLGLFPGSDANYISIRIGDRNAGFSGDQELALSLRNITRPIAGITPADVIQMGGTMSTLSPGSGFIGWGEQNREGGIEFYFRDGKLHEFYARWHRPEPSPFAIVFPPDRPLRFPVNDDQLWQTCGEGMVVEDFVGK